jgi:hypothetical protein
MSLLTVLPFIKSKKIGNIPFTNKILKSTLSEVNLEKIKMGDLLLEVNFHIEVGLSLKI